MNALTRAKIWNRDPFSGAVGREVVPVLGSQGPLVHQERLAFAPLQMHVRPIEGRICGAGRPPDLSGALDEAIVVAEDDRVPRRAASRRLSRILVARRRPDRSGPLVVGRRRLRPRRRFQRRGTRAASRRLERDHRSPKLNGALASWACCAGRTVMRDAKARVRRKPLTRSGRSAAWAGGPEPGQVVRSLSSRQRERC